MKLSVGKPELMAALEVAGGAINPRSPLPMYTALMLQTVGDEHLQVTGTNGELTLKALAPLESLVTEAGKVAVIAENFLSVVKGLKGPEIHLDSAKKTLEVKSGRSRYNLPTITGESWPVLARVENDAAFKLPEKDLAAALARVLPAVGTDDSRQILCGVFWKFEQGVLSLVATDTHRLQMATLPLPALVGQGSFILGADSAKQLVKILVGDGECLIFSDGAGLQVETNRGSFTSTLIGGEYLNYERFIAGTGEFVEFEQKELVEAIKRASFVAQGNADRLIITFRPDGSAKLAATSDQYGEAEEEVSIHGGGAGPQQFAVSARNLGAAVAAVPAPRVRLHRGTTMRAIRITAPDTDSYLGVVIPMRLPSDA